MKRAPYYPNRVDAQPEWLGTFADTLLTYAATLGVSNARRDAIVLDCLWLSYLLGTWAPAARAWAESVTEILADSQEGTGAAAMVLPVFSAPPLPPANAPFPATVPVPPGARDRIFVLVKDLKNAPGMTNAIATEMGIMGEEESPDTNPLPKFSLTVEQGMGSQTVALRFFKYGRTGVYVESRINGGAWAFLASPVVSPYTDTRPLLVANTPEVREYRMRYLVGNAASGDWTAVEKVTVGP